MRPLKIDTGPATAIRFETNGLQSTREFRDGTDQDRPHSHNEIEILLIEQGSGTWLMGGQVLTLTEGQLAVFWALKPHHLLECSKKTVLDWLTIPLALFSVWEFPKNLSGHLLAGAVVVDPDKSWFEHDRKAFSNWHIELKSTDPTLQKLALLEIEARLGRLAVHAQETLLNPVKNTFTGSAPMNHNYFRKVGQIAEFVSEHFAEPITIPQIAKVVDMHSTSATKLFRMVCGTNLVTFLTQFRILYAQRLLATTNKKILDVALESGYQSSSRFHAAFKKICGVSPVDFRNSFDLRNIPMERRQTGAWKVGKDRSLG